jgi:hypothetical protein
VAGRLLTLAGALDRLLKSGYTHASVLCDVVQCDEVAFAVAQGRVA